MKSSVAPVVAAVVAAWALLFFVLLPGNTITSFPIHHDDFNNLAHVWGEIRWVEIRPVSTLVIEVLGAAGITAYYLALHGLVIAYASLALLVVARLFRLDRLSIAPLAFVAVAALSYEQVVEYTKYTGLMTNLLSGVFGSSAMLALLQLPDSKRPRWNLAAAAVFSVMSFWSKEDFIVPVVLMAVYAFTLSWQDVSRRRQGAAALAVVVLLALGFFVYERTVQGFTQARIGVYKPNFEPSSIARTAWHYINVTPGSQVAFLFSLTPLIVRPKRAGWLAVGAYFALIAALALPYLCLPRHVFKFYCFNWTAWQAAGLLTLAATPGRLALRWAAAAAAAVVAFYVTQPGRRFTADWYGTHSQVTRNIAGTLIEHKEALSSSDVVVVEGAPFLGPWFGNSGRFLRTRYGFTNHWLVRVPSGSPYMTELRALLGRTVLGDVSTVPMESKTPPGAPILRLQPDGRGVVVPASD